MRVSAGQRVLDVAAGTGNVAIRAAQAGASLVASDVTPENFDAGRRAARAAGVDLERIEGDAPALLFADDEFDVVTSCFGVMFTPDHRVAASEMLRVCRRLGRNSQLARHGGLRAPPGNPPIVSGFTAFGVVSPTRVADASVYAARSI